MELNTKSDYQDLLKSWKAQNQAPDWMTWIAIQTLTKGYLEPDETVRDRYSTICKTLATHAPKDGTNWEQKFFDLAWKGWLAFSTPVLANTGTNKGMPVSCSGNFVADSLDSIYLGLYENAMLTKYGFGTSSYLGDLRSRGATISKGGQSSGIVSWIEQYRAMTSTVTQGATRRGAWAGYVDIESGDFYELMDYLLKTSHINIGIIVKDSFKERLRQQDPAAVKKYQKLLETRMITGKPYIFFSDTVNRLNPSSYIDNNLTVKASNLCTEITLHSDNDTTFTCVLSSMNAAKFDEWKDTDAVFTATVLLDCVAEEFIQKAAPIGGLEKAVLHTVKGRALGLGLLGFHTYLQNKGQAFDDLGTQFDNDIIFKHMRDESDRASKYLAEKLGEPEWCVGTGFRNTHRMAVAPNTSSALICGSISQGIEPVVSNVFVQKSAKGKFERINPSLLNLLRQKNLDTADMRSAIAMNKGSIQQLSQFTADEKRVFKTAYEINQKNLIRLAERRQKFIDQAQSLNLFFSANEDPQWIHEVHKEAFESDYIKSLYYVRTEAGISADKGSECIACEG